jgi:glycosyltransferase involved in cell wall biosynthesis
VSSMARAPGETQEIAGIVFSKDRPLQLDGMLRSLRLNCEDLDLSTIHVLYTTSNPFFAAQYHVLASEHPDIEFVREASFKPDLIRLVEGSSYVFFLVDDTLVVRPMSLDRTIQVLRDDPACLGFSFRLGRNTTRCYMLDRPQRLPEFDGRPSGVLTFDWTKAEFDFGYPIEVSSSIYRSSDLLQLLVHLDYHNPNTLESVLAAQASSFRDTRPRLACYETSVAFSVPANTVQTAWRNRVGRDPGLSSESLGQAFARGSRLNLERYQGTVAIACHQEIAFEFETGVDVPAVSVVIPCYGQADYLPEAVASVLGQTFTDWELVIVDDGSPDDTAAVASGLIEANPGRRIVLVRQANGGLSSARNAGVSASSGSYVLPLDADDKLDPRMLDETIKVIRSDPSIGYVYTDAIHFDQDTARVVEAEDYDSRSLVEHNQPNYCSLYPRSLWEDVGGYRQIMRIGYEDWDFWLSCLERGHLGRRLPMPLFWYRVRPGTMFSVALAHDRELRAVLKENHPSLFGRRSRLGRLARRAARFPTKTGGRLRRLVAKQTRLS